ncbi:tRNA-dihydrouridine(16/17) synthase [NAD(P)(+)]-like protein [Physocladia obscura]|uniref:tRNA-dihydrouridine(16/17) synthase [NAD(P)(+)] n=1 Tax=Physocladia obscura TaxID=109957 RepID=A0AAD5SSP3_9FUNG|nr:tRNA-dihydrouridine(16/17) synthase [NAD(P)(+)]-like protein [Physocladia obscura]
MVRRHGCALPYTQMIIANQFISDAEYRAKTFATSRGDGINTDDRPLVVQIAGSDPDTLLECARMLQNHCDAIDLNLGCPQHRAITDGYGASLLHKEKWPTVSQIVRLLSATLSVPIWCKIRLIPNNQTPAFAEMLQASGCKLITVHGRYASATRRRNGAADLDAIRAVKDAVSIPVVANGNVRGVEDLQRNMRLTGADGIMVGEAILVNPYIFEGSQTPENPSDIIREYLEICAQVPPAAFSIISARQHIRNFLRPNVRSNSPQFKEALQRAVTIPEILTVAMIPKKQFCRTWNIWIFSVELAKPENLFIP